MSEEAKLREENRILSNRVTYLEQAITGFIAHFGQHGHMIFENGTATGKPSPYRLPLFHPDKAPLTEVAAPQVETEVRPLFMPNAKPQPIPQP